jgi:thioester reductase-like protein
MTGATGFIGRRLVERILEETPGIGFAFLVQKKFENVVAADIARWKATEPGRDSEMTVHVGDITDPRLGLSVEEYDRLAAEVTEVWHLAAIYDLAVPFDVAKRINVHGTHHVLAFCKACSKLKKLVYFSTSYVSGSRTGLILEPELVEGQSFKNHYESTKFAAEVAVRQAIDAGLPGVIIRPGIVVGDSRTGETDKFDGPYFGMQFVHSLKWLPIPLPRPGASKAEVNLVPIDYLVAATVALAHSKKALGGTYQVVDPAPMPAKELYTEICRLITGKPSMGEVPPALLDATLSVKPISKLLGVPKEVLVYFNHPAKYDSARTLEMLEGTGVTCPDMHDYLPTLFRYWSEHRGAEGYQAKS